VQALCTRVEGESGNGERLRDVQGSGSANGLTPVEPEIAAPPRGLIKVVGRKHSATSHRQRHATSFARRAPLWTPGASKGKLLGPL
jgi:hypothetical protein